LAKGLRGVGEVDLAKPDYISFLPPSDLSSAKHRVHLLHIVPVLFDMFHTIIGSESMEQRLYAVGQVFWSFAEWATLRVRKVPTWLDSRETIEPGFPNT